MRHASPAPGDHRRAAASARATLEVCVADDGGPAGGAPGGGFGLMGMRERAEAWAASFNVQSGAGRRRLARPVRLPLRPGAARAGGARRMKVLIVDDHAIVRDGAEAPARHHRRRADHEEATSGAEAVSAGRARRRSTWSSST